MDSLIVLTAQIQGSSAWLWVNGVVVGLVEPGATWVQSIHQYLVRGANDIRLQRVDAANFLPKTEVWVHLNIQLVGKDKNQMLHRWNTSHPGLKWIKGGCLLQVDVDLPVSFPRWKFMDIQQMKAEPSDAVCIQYFLPELLGALLKRDFATLHAMFSIRNKELCTAYGLDTIDFADCFKKRVMELSQSMESASFHINPEDCVCIPTGIPTGSSPLYYLSDKANRPFLNWVDPAGEWSIPLHLAVIQRQVYVVR
jgi:hypothetical protein